MSKPEEWKIKVNEDGSPSIEGTKVTFIAPDGKELSLDPPQMYGKIIELGKESKTTRKKYDAVKDIATMFEGIDDIPTWKEEAENAIKAVKNFNDKDWMKAEKVEKLKTEMAASYDQKLETQKTSYTNALTEKDGVIVNKDSQIHKLLVTNNFTVHPLFGGSKPLSKLSPDVAEAFFGKHFRVEASENNELTLRAYKDPGRFEDPIYSREDPGEFASFPEAMNFLWDKYPGKDNLMVAGKAGSGARGGSGGADNDSDLTSLEDAHAKALKENRIQDAVALKNQIFRLRQAVKR